MPTFSHLLQRWYQQQPEKVSVYLQHGGQPDLPITYRMLVEGSAAYAAALQQHGVAPGEVVVLILQHGRDLIYAFFGAVLHGAIPSIMPYLTAKLLPERYRADLSALVAVTQPAAILTYPEFEVEVRAALKPGDSVRAVLVADQVITTPAGAPDFTKLGGLKRDEEDVAILQHSSGTTGLQKGVALSHRAVLNQLEAYSRAIHFTDEDVIVSWLPLYHDMGLIAGFLNPILFGVSLVLMSPFDWVRAPARLMQAVSQYKGTLSWLPNFAYNFCAQKIRERHMQGIDLSSWRVISNCSEPMRYESHMAFYEKFAPYGLKFSALATCYAMAENVFAVTQGGVDAPVTVDEIDRDAFQMQRVAVAPIAGQPTIKMLSAGKAIQHTQVRVITAEGADAVERQVGEIALRSNCMLTGYYHRPDETRKALRDGWYLTGDYGYRVGDELYVSGRKKELIIVGGKNVYPGDLEQLAMEVKGVHAGRVVAFGIFNEESGTEEVYMVAEVEISDPAEREAMAEQLGAHVTRGSAVALRYVHLVDKGWLIKTSSGKNARLANKEKYIIDAGRDAIKP
jgi:fatty-acyl-CoA synthase